MQQWIFWWWPQNKRSTLFKTGWRHHTCILTLARDVSIRAFFGRRTFCGSAWLDWIQNGFIKIIATIKKCFRMQSLENIWIFQVFAYLIDTIYLVSDSRLSQLMPLCIADLTFWGRSVSCGNLCFFGGDWMEFPSCNPFKTCMQAPKPGIFHDKFHHDIWGTWMQALVFAWNVRAGSQHRTPGLIVMKDQGSFWSKRKVFLCSI